MPKFMFIDSTSPQAPPALQQSNSAAAAISSITLPSATLGTPGANRVVLVVVATVGNPLRTVSALTVAGNSATLVSSLSIDSFRNFSIWKITDAVNATGNVAVTWSGGIDFYRISIYSMTIAGASGTPVQSTTSSAASKAAAITVPAGGYGIFVGMSRDTSNPVDAQIAWSGTGVAEVHDEGISGTAEYGFAYSASAGAVTGTATWGATDVGGVIGVPWSP